VVIRVVVVALSIVLAVLAGCRQLFGFNDLPVDAGGDAMADADPSCSCANDLLHCASGDQHCYAGCDPVAPRCLDVVPSNGVPVSVTTETDVITIGATATFDTDTGEVTGAVIRAPVQGVASGISYTQMSATGVAVGVFGFSQLDVAPSGVIRIVGSRPAVFVVATAATIDGLIDGTGGVAACTTTQRTPVCAGPGGGDGAAGLARGMGCGGGAHGLSDPFVGGTGADSGGGGGGGGGSGANGGTEVASGVTFLGGTGGMACIALTLEPLVGGGGGGGGGGGSARVGYGGGGGGALQLTALQALRVAGAINMGGGGGEGGQPDGSNGGAGGGAGAGGGILIEAPMVTVDGVLAANGGGGGGGAAQAAGGGLGETGRADATAAAGGTGGGAAGSGGAGGCSTAAPQPGVDANGVNAGAGGGGIGRIYVRSRSPASITTSSPAAGTGALNTR
jgi:hypothetical protein